RGGCCGRGATVEAHATTPAQPARRWVLPCDGSRHLRRRALRRRPRPARLSPTLALDCRALRLALPRALPDGNALPPRAGGLETAALGGHEKAERRLCPALQQTP